MSTAIVQKNTASATTTNTNNIIYFDCGDIFAAIFFRMMFKDYFYKYNVDMCTRPCITVECLKKKSPNSHIEQINIAICVCLPLDLFDIWIGFQSALRFLDFTCRSKFEVTMLPTFLSELAQFIYVVHLLTSSMRLQICSPFDNSERYRHHEHILGL
uniref:Uncharacterized protein n=1 Tax=Glossina palpalis gambiensis TaxID=67801 RepID=A0A1B0BCU9_9MUSC